MEKDQAKIDFIYLSEPDMIKAGVTDMTKCVDAMQEMFELLYRGDYRMAGSNNDSHGAMVTFPENSPFPNMPKPTADRRFMAMPAYLGGSFGTSGVKWYGSNIANKERGLPRSILMFILNDTDTGAPLAIMSANLLSAYRTGAIPGVGARFLARPDSKVLGILGPGVMAKTSLSAFIVACPEIDTLKVKGRSRKSLDSYIAWVKESYPQITNIIEVEDAEALVRDSDIVAYCTSGQVGNPDEYPLIKREWVKAGAFLSMSSLCNIDDAMAKEARLVMDNPGLYHAWAEELPRPLHHNVPLIGCKFIDLLEAGVLPEARLEDLGKIVAKEAPARQNNDEIILMSVGGMPVEDVAWGTYIYRSAKAQGLGVPLNLWETPALA